MQIIDRIHVQKVLGDISAEDFAAFRKDAIVLKMLEAEMFGESQKIPDV